MAKRVFELAKELSVKSKAIVEKCQAEDIPNIQNHMSSVSAGLEATIREWFSSEADGSATAVETAEKVDIEKVRAAPKKKARAKASKASAKRADDQVTETETATAVAEPPAPAAPVVPPAAAGREEETESKKPSRIKKAPALAADAEANETGSAPDDADPSDQGTAVAEPAAASPAAPPTMNVPTRPEVVKPAGPTIEDVEKKPAKLLGPKVVRVEAPDVVDVPRSRRPAGAGEPSMPTNRRPRGGAGAGGPAPMEDDSRGGNARRNKRRGAPQGAPGGGRGDRRGGGRPGSGGGGSGSWRQQDLIEREARLNRSEGFLRQRRRDQKMKGKGQSIRAATPAQTGGTVKVTTPLSIKDLSAATGVKAAEIVKKLFMQGIMASVNSAIEAEKAQEIMLEYDIELEVEEQKTAAEQVELQFEGRETVDEQKRAPVVTILGHVDHGKTSLLDKIRNANVAAGEAGGITQATSAFRVPVSLGEDSKEVCFLDTPGHQAFSEMRSRGANMTDIVVLVIAAPEGVMPQTLESINHAKAAGVPVVVALNKIDTPGLTDEQIQLVLGQLAEQELNPTEWGGSTDVVRTSAITGEGIPELLETLDYQAELLDLKADFGGAARGVVFEARHVEGRGATANLLVQEGELEVGNIVVAGRAYGRVRDITNDRAKRIKSATPSTPVTISGLDQLPDAGDKFFIVDSLKKAQEAAEHVEQAERERALAQPKVTLDSMFAQMQAGDLQELLLVLKADVQGSVDVIKNEVEKIANDEVKVRVLHAAAGGITDSDITLAAASGAVIIGFNVIAAGSARKLAEAKNVEIRNYQVIYDVVDDMKQAAEGLLAPELRQEVLGHAEVRKVFKISKVGAVAGCYVTDGTIERNALIRVTRDDIVIENDRVLEQLKRFKDDAKDVRSGQECGMKIVGYDDIKEGDVLECYRQIEVKRTL